MLSEPLVDIEPNNKLYWTSKWKKFSIFLSIFGIIGFLIVATESQPGNKVDDKISYLRGFMNIFIPQTENTEYLTPEYWFLTEDQINYAMRGENYFE